MSTQEAWVVERYGGKNKQMMPPATSSTKPTWNHTLSTYTRCSHETTDPNTPPVLVFGELFRQVEQRSVSFISSVNKTICWWLQVCWNSDIWRLWVPEQLFCVFLGAWLMQDKERTAKGEATIEAVLKISMIEAHWDAHTHPKQLTALSLLEYRAAGYGFGDFLEAEAFLQRNTNQSFAFIQKSNLLKREKAERKPALKPPWSSPEHTKTG